MATASVSVTAPRGWFKRTCGSSSETNTSLRVSDTSLCNIVPRNLLERPRSQSQSQHLVNDTITTFENVDYVLDNLRHQLQHANIEQAIIEGIVQDIADDPELICKMLALLEAQHRDNVHSNLRLIGIFDLISCNRTLAPPRLLQDLSNHSASYMPLVVCHDEERRSLPRSFTTYSLTLRKHKKQKKLNKCTIM